MRPFLVAAFVALTALAGCTDEPNPLLTPQRETAYKFQGYTWTPDMAIGQADGNRTGNTTWLDQHPLLGEVVAPHHVQQMVPHGGAEPNIGITSAGNIFVSTYENVQRSSDHGLTWEVVHRFVAPTVPTTEDGWRMSDPMLWVDQATDRIYSLNMHPGTTCFAMAWSDDEGETWSDRVGGEGRPGLNCNLPYVDHPKLVTGPARAGELLQPLDPAFPRMLYVCTNKVADAINPPLILGSWCSTSFDGGRTWAYETRAIASVYDTSTVPPTPVCLGINGHPAIHPDGTVVVPAGNLGGSETRCHRPPTVAVSTDHGRTWEERVYDGPLPLESVSIDPDITITPDGTAYLVYRDMDDMTYILRSPDMFQTWEGPFRVSPPDHALNAFQAITSGDDGRIAVVFLATLQAPTPHEDPAAPRKGPSRADGGTRWNVYMARSHDANTDSPTFHVQQVNPYEDPAQVGCIWLAGGVSSCRNLLDFIDITHDADGRVVAAITDGCVPRNGCTADPQNVNYQSGDRHVSVVVQDRGESLFADKGILPSLGLVHPPWPEEEAHAEVPA